MNFQIVTDTQTLAKACTQARQKEAVMLDTEFVRTRTFFPQLGLVQMYDGELLSLIDTTVIDDITPIVELLQDQDLLKVLHACGEDIEVFQHHFQSVPTPMADTQVMAAFLGHGLSTGFASLVSEYLSVDLDKSESRTDWLARPLTDKQLDYAAADVFYLKPLFDKLHAALQESGHWQDALQESKHQVGKRIRHHNPENAYLDIKGAWQLSPKQLNVLKPLAIWRYETALRKDLALNFVFKEADLLSVARFNLTSSRDMERQECDVRSVRRYSTVLGNIVRNAQNTPESEWPEKIDRLVDLPNYKQTFKTLKDEVNTVVKQSHFAPEFLASKKQINQLISWVWRKDKAEDATPDLMQGWRKSLLGERLLKKLD
ncbi:ribonuclease D [Vibrio sp. UCD-FRSSP16_10]|uniref:ribonuclease D n=1 Tax=unclassified Vibrio TaxID=2614977 RepID=UPI0007FCB165|nr:MULTISPECIES: ribonuclease D [unclassified Vibrio]OBT08557.1 ribonuclease D [Vibrio sp. UCD-FRSSP16_30]OBT18087.1 ribonuclease D [Vibrio sp. UCD-FRSSP16_10]